MIYTDTLDSRRPYDHLPPSSWPAIRCYVCKRPAVDHGPMGECYALASHDYEPWSFRAWRQEDERMREATR